MEAERFRPPLKGRSKRQPFGLLNLLEFTQLVLMESVLLLAVHSRIAPFGYCALFMFLNPLPLRMAQADFSAWASSKRSRSFRLRISMRNESRKTWKG